MRTYKVMMTVSGRPAIKSSIKRPKLPRGSVLAAATDRDVAPEATLEQVVLSGFILEYGDFGLLTLRQVRGDQLRLAGSDLAGSAVVDTVLQTIDASNTKFGQSRLERVQVEDSKFTGAHFENARLIDAVFADCRMDMISFRQAKSDRLAFERCNLRGADFRNAELAGAMFTRCDLSGADFSHADLAGADLRLSRLDDLIIEPGQLRGVIVSSDQALFLCGLLGLVIDDGV